MGVVTRRTARDTSYAYRYSSTSVKELRLIEQWKAVHFLSLTQLMRATASMERRGRLHSLLRGFAHYRKLVTYVVPDKKSRRLTRTDSARTIDSFTDTECWHYFRTRKEDLYRLQRAFKLDSVDGAFLVASNGSKFTKEEILLIGLHRYCVPGPLAQVLGSVYNMDFSMLSRAITLFNDHMIGNFSHLLLNNLAFWKPYFAQFAEAIRSKLHSEGGIFYSVNGFRVFGFHDDTVIATCRPGSGPAPGGGRHDNFIQMSFYNGWKKHHGYKYQTLELPNGMTAHMYGPVSFRHNDVEVLRDSMLNEQLAEVQAGEPLQYVSYGDGIFPIRSHTIGKHVGDTTPEERHENKMMSKIRVANEWSYGATANLFPFVKYKASLKMRHNKHSTRFYFVATLLRNAHVCLYEGLCNSYFKCNAVDLYTYFGVE